MFWLGLGGGSPAQTRKRRQDNACFRPVNIALLSCVSGLSPEVARAWTAMVATVDDEIRSV